MIKMNIESFSFNESFSISEIISLTIKSEEVFEAIMKKYHLISKLQEIININKFNNKIMKIKVNLSFYKFFTISSNIFK